MSGSAKKSRSARKRPATAHSATESFRSEALAQALARQDMAAVALALRHGTTIVPLLAAGARDDPRDGGEVWTYRDPATGEVALLLFSDARNAPANLPAEVGVYTAEWLRSFLTTHAGVITTVFLDIAGPAPMQAEPQELLRALDPGGSPSEGRDIGV